MKYPPYARNVIARRQAGALVGLCIVASGWQAGEYFGDSAAVLRVVLPDDLALDGLKWDYLAGLDVLVCPAAETPDARYHALLLAALGNGANSVWGEFGRGVCRVFGAHGRVFAQNGPLPLNQLALALKFWRRHQLLAGCAVYADPDWDETRVELVEQLVAQLEAA